MTISVNLSSSDFDTDGPTADKACWPYIHTKLATQYDHELSAGTLRSCYTRDWLTVINQVLGHATENHHTKLVLDSLRYIKPTKRGVQKPWPALVQHVCTNDHINCDIQHFGVHLCVCLSISLSGLTQVHQANNSIYCNCLVLTAIHSYPIYHTLLLNLL